jgi:hypothetical protein
MLLAAAFTALALPIYVIRPFRAQGATELAVALAVSRWKPYLTILCLLLGAWTAARLWRGARVPGRLGVTLSVLLLAGMALLAQVNVFELMFQPMRDARFVPAAEAVYEPETMVMAVRLGPKQEARAYPIRILAYHHLLNDVVAGEPIVSTY